MNVPIKKHCVRFIQLREVLHALKVCDRLIGNTGDIGPGWRVDSGIGFQVVGLELHHAAAAIGDQDVVVAVLLVGNHIQRLIAHAEVGDLRALHFGAGLQLAHRDLHQRRAGVSRQDVLLLRKSCTERTSAPAKQSHTVRARNARSAGWRPEPHP